jgi:hypothetical protein
MRRVQEQIVRRTDHDAEERPLVGHVGDRVAHPLAVRVPGCQGRIVGPAAVIGGVPRALLLSGIGFIVLALGALRPATTAANKSAPGTVPVTA